jgi:hypothetical protein
MKRRSFHFGAAAPRNVAGIRRVLLAPAFERLQPQ